MMKTRHYSALGTRLRVFRANAMMAVMVLAVSMRPAPAQNDDFVTVSAIEFQQLVYSAHLLAQMDEKPELDASLQVLLELHRRNPKADRIVLVGVLRQAIDEYRTQAPPGLRKHGSRDEILAAYLCALLRIGEHAHFGSPNLTLLNSLMTRAPAPTGEPQADMFHSGSRTLLEAEGDLAKRRGLLDACTARAQLNSGFRAGMDDLLQPETFVSLGNTPAEIVGNTNSALHGNPTIRTLVAISATNSGSLTVSSNTLVTLFTNETQTFWDIIHTNLALQRDVDQSHPDLMAYLADKEAMDADAQRFETLRQGQSRQIASATAAVLVHSKLMQAAPPMLKLSGQMQGVVEGLHKFTDGLAAFGEKDATKLARIAASGNMVAGGLQLLSLFTGGETAEDSIAREIGNLKTLLGDLSTNMNYRFDRVDQSLTEIFNTLNERFDQVEIKLDAQGRQIAQLNGDVDKIRFSLLDVQTDLVRIERNLSTFHALDWRFGLLEQMNLGLGYEARVGTPMAYDLYSPSYVGMENVFFTHAYNRAASETLSRCDTLPVGDADLYYQLCPGGATNVYAETLNYIRKGLRERLGQTYLPAEPPLVNPQDWSAGAMAWLQLALENPGHFRKYQGSLDRLNGIINQGRELTNFFRSLTFAGANLNRPLYDALKDYYLGKLASFTHQVRAAEQQFATGTNFALDSWRRWDIEAPRVTSATTQVLPAATVADSIADWSPAGTAGQNGWVCGYYDRSLDPNGMYQDWDFAAFPHDGRGYSATDFWTGYSYDWYAGNPPWDEMLGEMGHPNSNNGGAVDVANHGTHEHWVVRRWISTVDGNFKCRFRFRKVNLACGDGVIGLVYRNGALIYSQGIAGNDRVGRDDVIALPALRVGQRLDFMLAPGSLDHCDGSAFSATIFPGEPAANRWLTSDPSRGHIGAGSVHTLSLKADGTVLGWGAGGPGTSGGPNLGQTTIPPGLNNVVAVVGGYRHSLAIKGDGTVVGWGDNYRGEINIPAGLNNVVGLAGGTWFTLAVKGDGTVVGWGDNRQGETTIPPGLNNVVAVAAGENHSLALRADGTLVAWGDNSYGQTSIPGGLWSMTAIAAGDYHCLALGQNGRVVGWGDNRYGQVAIPAAANSNVVAIAARGLHSVALKSDGTVLAWGYNSAGEATVPAGLNNVVAIAAGDMHNVALKADGAIVCWGDNRYRQATTLASAIDLAAWGHYPAGLWDVPSGPSPVTAVASGSAHTLALTAGGSVLAWGLNTWGQTNVPSQAQQGVVALAAGLGHSLVLTTNGSVLAWGLNDLGQANVPASAQSGIVAISAGAKHSLALSSLGDVFAWGLNGSGQANVPPDVQGRAVAIAAGGEHNLALTTEGVVWAWGGNSSGQATVSTEARSGVVAIAAGRYHSLALATNGSVVAWGLNTHGECTVPSWAQSGVVAISAGLHHSAALKADGTVVVWGSGPAAFELPVWSNIVAIAAGDQHTMALQAGAPSGGDRENAIPFVRASIPVRVVSLLRANHDYLFAESSRAGPLQTAGTELSGAKALLTAVLELAMPYTLERDDVLHGFLYGSEPLMDLDSARIFYQKQNVNLLTRPAYAPLVLSEVANLRFLRFAERLQACLDDLAATRQPEYPRLVDHTLRLLELLRDSWSTVSPPVLEMFSAADSPRLLLYGEPHANYAVQYSDSLEVPNWTTGTITNLHDQEQVRLPAPGSTQRFYRAVLPAR